MKSSSLQELFNIERQTHLEVLVSGAKKILSGDVEGTAIDSMFRAAHALKGAARLVDAHATEQSAHKLEDILKCCVAGEVLTDVLQRDILNEIETLGGRVLLAAPNVEPSENVGAGLHIQTRVISQLIQLANELAVICRRVDTSLQRMPANPPGSSPDFASLREDGQQSTVLATSIQRMAHKLRLAPLSEVTTSLVTVSESLALETNKKVNLKIVNGSTLVDRELLKRIEPCLLQLLKNSIDHAIEPSEERIATGKPPHGSISIIARQFGSTVEIEFHDDGAGIEVDKIRRAIVNNGHHTEATAKALSDEEVLAFIFLPGFTTRETVSNLSGRGIGLDIVKDTVSSVGGDVRVSTKLQEGSSFYIRIPSEIASFRALLFQCDESTVAVPLTFVLTIQRLESLPPSVCGRAVFHTRVRGVDKAVPLVKGSAALRLTSTRPKDAEVGDYVIVLTAGFESVALLCDRIIGEEEIVVHKLDRRFAKEQRILGTTVCSGNSLVTVLDVEQFLGEHFAPLSVSQQRVAVKGDKRPAARLLIVDDSLTVRELERQLLLRAGYECEVAIDGVDGLEKAEAGSFALIISDIDMPRMGGFEFVRKLRGSSKHHNTPILMVSYKDRDEDRLSAASAGADGYLSKGSFKDDSFLQAVKGLLKEST